MSMHMNVEYLPPFERTEIISTNENENDGRVSSISMLLQDANHKLFTFHVMTDEVYQKIVNDEDMPSNERETEPVFVLPTSTIDVDMIDTIINALSPKLFSLYLVPQETSQ